MIDDATDWLRPLAEGDDVTPSPADDDHRPPPGARTEVKMHDAEELCC